MSDFSSAPQNVSCSLFNCYFSLFILWICFCHFNTIFVTLIVDKPVTSNKFLVISQNCYRNWKKVNKRLLSRNYLKLLIDFYTTNTTAKRHSTKHYTLHTTHFINFTIIYIKILTFAFVILDYYLIYRLIIPDDVLIQFDLLMMSTVMHETCREV